MLTGSNRMSAIVDVLPLRSYLRVKVLETSGDVAWAVVELVGLGADMAGFEAGSKVVVHSAALNHETSLQLDEDHWIVPDGAVWAVVDDG